MAKIGGVHCGKNGWNSLWQKWVKLIVAKMGETGVKDIKAKMVEAHNGKNRWNWCHRYRGKNGWN